ncbi:MAG: sigma-70 family RNA polymerase sigma factor [Anaerolineales bacterium]|nr:sigma-70 family RNA polymerase sigma factor [Anaerolineales bacterium]
MPEKPDFDMLVEAHSKEIFAYLWRMIGEPADAEDCLQETFLRAFQAYARLNMGANYRAWLYKIATNVARTFLKQRWQASVRMTDIDPDELPSDHTSLEVFDKRARLAAVATAVEALPHKQRAALIMRKYQCMSYEEVAYSLGGTEDAARANVYQAIKKLRTMLVPENS